MNHIYRIVWNSALSAWVAVCETARGHGKRSGGSGALAAVALAGALLAPPMALAQVASVVVAPGGRTNAYVAPNGVTIVNIETANAAGLSHNRYQQFNVDPKGLVLNNTGTQQAAYQSQLAGQVMANYNTNTPARVILNEVVANNRSTLAGFTEVLGGRADVVLANPYGITCTGCGFINTDRVTLTTGTPFFTANGGLGGFNVNQGDIVVAGSGLNATAQQILDLVTRSVRIDGTVNAQELGIVTGPNQWDYGTRAITGSTGAQGTAPAYAIDSSALGGMYANRIRLTATENGIGVRLLGDAAASGDDFTLSAAGRIELRNRVSAQRDVLVASSASDDSALALVDASLSAGRDMALRTDTGGVRLAGGALVADGSLSVDAASLIDQAGSADIANNNLRSAASALALNIAGAATIGATQWRAGGQWQGQFGSIATGAGARFQAGGSLLARSAGDLDLGAALVQSKGDLTLAASGTLRTLGGTDQALQSTDGNLRIEAGAGLENAGILSADQGAVVLRVDGAIANSGTVNAGTALDIADRAGGGTQDVANSGLLTAGSTLTLKAAAVRNTPGSASDSGWIQAADGSTIDVASLDNAGTWLLSHASATGPASQLTVAGTLANSGALQAQGDAVVSAGAIRNETGGLLRTGGRLDLQLGAPAAGESSLRNAGTVQAGGVLAIGGDDATLENRSGAQLLGGELAVKVASIDNAGTLQGRGADSVETHGLLHNSGTLTLAANGGAGVVTALGVVNDGALQSGGDLQLTLGTQGLTSDGDLLALGDLRLQGDSYAVALKGTLEAGGLFSAQGGSGSRLDLLGTASAHGGTIDIDMGQLALARQTRLSADGDLAVDVDALTLAGDSTGTAQIQAAMNQTGSGTIDVASPFVNNGLLFSGSDLHVTAEGITNGLTGGIAALQDLHVTARTGDLTNRGALYAGRDLYGTAASGTLSNTGTLTAYEGSIDAGRDITLNATTVVNNSTITSLRDLSITADEIRNELFGGGARKEVQQNLTGQGSPYYTYTWTESADKRTREYYRVSWDMVQCYVDAQNQCVSPDTLAAPAQMSAGGALKLSYANSLKNLGGVLSGDSVTLTGTGANAAFVNDDLALRTRHMESNYYYYTHYVAQGGLTYNDTGWYVSGQEGNESNDTVTCRKCEDPAPASIVDGGTRMTGSTTTHSLGAGVFANAPATSPTDYQLVITGTSVQNNGSTMPSADFEASGPAGGATVDAPDTPTAPGGGGTIVPVSGTDGRGAVRFGGITITLPTNPNGLYVVARSPGANYLVETNPLYQVGSATFGSDYLARLLGYNADQLGLRLGDASYEAYLVRQQLVSQTGNVLLAGYRNADAQMQALMDGAASANTALGLTYGEPLTAAQQAALKQDIVWMVKTVVDGKTVLAPMVYLAQSTRDTIARGAVISADAASMNLSALTNTGGTIVGGKSLLVASTGDISNLSGLIQGGDVKLTSTEGSIVNRTVAEGSGNDAYFSTVVGKTAGIQSTGTLTLDAKKDIANIGATMSAGTDATLKAGGDISFDTVENRTVTTTRGDYTVKHGSGTTTTTTDTVQQLKSGLSVGGNLDAKAGNDITFAGTDAKVGGNASLDAGNDIHIVARENSTTTHTESKASGFGMNNSLWGSTKTTTDSESIRNVGSSFEVGGDAALKAAQGITLQGSDLKVAGNGSVASQTLDILAGRNSDTSTTTTTNKGVLGVSGNGKDDSHKNTSAGTATATGSGSATAKGGVAQASGTGQASAGGKASGGLHFSTSTTTTTETENTTHVGSNLSFGGNADLKVRDTLTLEGSQLSSGGDMNIAAADVKVLTVEDVAKTSTKSTTTTIGLLGSTDNKVGLTGSGSAQATGGTGRAPGVKGSASAGATASSYNELNFVDVQKSSSSTTDLTHQGSGISAGGNLGIQATNLLVSGSEIAADKDVTLDAKNQRFEAVNDVHETTSSSNRTTFGLYVGGTATASAQASGNAGIGLNYNASASAKAEATAGMHGTNVKSSSVEGSTTAVVSSIKAGGNINRNAEGGTIADVGTSIQAGGDLNQKAATWTSEAASNTTYGTTTSERTDARVGLYANASVSAETSQGAGTGSGSASTDSGASAGIRASVQHERSKDTDASSTAVVSTIQVGGSVKSQTTGTTTLQGTQIDAGQDVTLGAKTLKIEAAEDTASSKGMEMSAGLSGEVDLLKRKVGGAAGGSGGTTSGESSTAVVAGIRAGNQLTLQSSGDMALVGTQLAAGGGAAIDAGGQLQFQAATSTSESHSKEGGASVSVGTQSADPAKDTSKSSRSGSASVNYQQADTQSSTATAGSLVAGGPVSIRSGGDATFTGTRIESGGDASVAAGGALTFEAAHSTAQATGGGFALGAQGKSGKTSSTSGTTETQSGAASASINYGKTQSDQAQVASITSGGNMALSSGKDMTLVGTQATAGGQLSVDAGGAFIQKEVKSTTKQVGFDLSADGSVQKSTKTPAPAPAPAAPQTPASTPPAGPPSTPPPLTPLQKPGVNPVPASPTVGPGTNPKPPTKPPSVSPPPTPGVTGAPSSPPASKPPSVPPPPTPPAPPKLEAPGGLLSGATTTAATTVSNLPPKDQIHGGANLGVVNKSESTTQTTSLSGGNGVVIRSGGNTANGAQIQASVPIPAGLPPGKQASATTADGKPLPGWLAFDPASGTFKGQPPADFKGELQVQVSVPQPDGSVKSVPMRFGGK